MHTVRNRVAAKPRNKGTKPPRGSYKKQESAFMLRSGNPPAFPSGLIVPPPRGAMITAVPWPEVAMPGSGISTKVAARSKTGANPSAKAKTRKAKPRKHHSKSAQKVRTVAKSTAVINNSPAQEAPVSMLTEDLLDRALAMKPLPAEDALITPSQLPPTPVTSPPMVAGVTPPLPRSQALAPSRGQGLFDVIGHWLRDAGSWIVRLRKSRRKGEERARIARTKARHHALQSQFDALEALREVARAD